MRIRNFYLTCLGFNTNIQVWNFSRYILVQVFSVLTSKATPQSNQLFCIAFIFEQYLYPILNQEIRFSHTKYFGKTFVKLNKPYFKLQSGYVTVKNASHILHQFVPNLATQILTAAFNLHTRINYNSPICVDNIDRYWYI